MTACKMMANVKLTDMWFHRQMEKQCFI